MYFEMVSNIVSMGEMRSQNILRGLIKHGEIEAQQNLYLKSEVHLYLMYLKWGTSEVHKRGLTRFLDDLGIMHFEANTLASKASKSVGE